MDRQRLIVQTKLTPPRLQKHILHRPRLTSMLGERSSYRLTLVQAGTGYGKSTSLAAFAEQFEPVIWYQLASEDTEASVFLLHLIHAFRKHWPELGEAPLALLEEWGQSPGSSLWREVVDSLVSELSEKLTAFAYLILDDVHLLNQSARGLRIFDRFIARAPATLQIISATRHPLELPSLITWRVRDEVQLIDQRSLAFTQEEIGYLFRDQYGLEVTHEQIAYLERHIEGWPIALPLIRERLQRDKNLSIEQALGQVAGPRSELFSFLAQEVLERQPADIRRFLNQTAVLRQLTPAVCDHIRMANDSQAILRYLLDNGLFIIDLGNGHSRYHNLFRDLLLSRLSAAAVREKYLHAGHYYTEQNQEEEAIFHFLSAGAYEEAAEVLQILGQQLIREGRLDTLVSWIGSLSPDTLARNPTLLIYLGDIDRLRSRFDKALAWYAQAKERSWVQGDIPGVSKALRGQARVYLDTVESMKAEALLQQALQLSDGQADRESQARLLELLAENMINQGHFSEAERYQLEAQQLRQEGPGEDEIPVRLLLRTGKLDQARTYLEKQEAIEAEEPVLRPRAHRETLLLLSLVLAFQGEQVEAYQTAKQGTARGQALNSPFITAVGLMRQGHAWLLTKEYDGYIKAQVRFEQAIGLSETLSVPRLKAEANWGLVQAFGFRGDLDLARKAFEVGLAIAQSAGDGWIEASLRLVMGASNHVAGKFEQAIPWLRQAFTNFRECGDTYGESVSRLWLNLNWWRNQDETRLGRDLGALLEQVQRHRYDYLFLRKTLLGPPDPRSLVPLLLFARHSGQNAQFANQLLRKLQLESILVHPGYQLRIHVLGRFSVSQGTQSIERAYWKRKKALRLFQLLLTNRGRMLDRDQITETLWPDLEPNISQRDFKIAYSTMNRVLEPERKRNAPNAFTVREDTLYGLRTESDIWVDVDDMDDLIRQGDTLFENNVEAAIPYYQEAIGLYKGEYLQELPYAEWCSEERERLLALILKTADRLTRTLAARNNWQEAIDVCRFILSHDDCWEQAYRVMMVAHDQLGNRAKALRIFQQCEERLQTELGVQPSASTIALHEAIQEESLHFQQDENNLA